MANYYWSIEDKKKLSQSHLGKHHSKKTREKMSNSAKGKHHYWLGKKRTTETKIKIGKSHKGKHLSEEHKKKLSELMSGENHFNWQGGISFRPYSQDWTETLRKSIRERDNYICRLCGKTQIEELERKLSVHHIDYNKQNCNPDNLITLCNNCNIKINKNRDYWTNYFKLNYYN